jgi:ankyrin repeat/BTB/POZ domain-containing protein 1
VTADLTIEAYDQSFHVHKFLLAARSPYFAKKLRAAPNTATWTLPQNIPSRSLGVALQYLYFSEVSMRRAMHGLSDQEETLTLKGIDKIGRQLEMDRLFDDITEISDRRLLRQKRAEELDRGRDQLETWFKENVLRNKVDVETANVDKLRWDRENSIYADILLRADNVVEDYESDETGASPSSSVSPIPPARNILGIPVRSRSPSRSRKPRKSTIYPVHKAMLLRSEYFSTMLNSPFREAQQTPYLQIVTLDCSPSVLETILTFLYTERSDFGLDVAIDVLFTADQLFVEKLKQRAALIISTLGNGNSSTVESENPRGETDAEEVIDIYEVIRAGWDTRVQRLEEFGARYIAYRLESYIDTPEFAEIVQESARRVKVRQETDTVELVDDIRYYLSDRFRLRFEDSGLEEMMEQGGDADAIAEAMDALGVKDEDEEKKGRLLGKEIEEQLTVGGIRTLDGEIAGDEFAQDAINYQILLGKIDQLLDNLNLDA